ncbi:hypothetical protein CFBP1590_0395 [Pseudomonas viridiflava]|uniref:DUF4935 domain-containing protein n=2 Tax=Pseudomonas viridiflava TaxID=33069 RepID=A0A1Y6JFM1_PSEVI|nr:hypothetical protein CFBP1590_0395 [Pseudomonas viridiflava]
MQRLIMKDAPNIYPESSAALRKKLVSGEITAITFDTQVFDRNGRTFKGGLIGQLAQLKSSHIKLLITELVRDEAEKHMLAMHKAKAAKVEDALSYLQHHLSESLFEEVRDELSTRMTPENIVFHEVNDFFLATDAELISYEESSTRKLFERYFSNAPPFHKLNSKKSEFPDAIALLCIEEYAANHGVLVVSEDIDWITFCRESKASNLHCVPDLSIALTLINSVEKDIEEIADQRFQMFRNFSDSGHLLSVIKKNVSNDLKDNLIFSGRTSFLYTPLCTEVEIVSFEVGDSENFGVIRDDSSLTAWVLELDLKCFIEVYVTFTEPDETYLGSSRYEAALVVPSVSIVKIANEDIRVETMIDKKTIINLGAIEPGEDRTDESWIP